MPVRSHPLAEISSSNSLIYDLTGCIDTAVKRRPLPGTINKNKRDAWQICHASLCLYI